MGDLISRSALLAKAFPDEYDVEHVLRSDIEKAPSVDAEPLQRGHWLDDPYVWQCSECRKWFECAQGDADLNYCPHCGAKMY